MNYSPKLIREKAFGIGSYPGEETVDKNGHVLIPVGSPDGDYYLYSADRGKTFEKLEKNRELPSVSFLLLKNGSLMGVAGSNFYFHALFNKEQKNIPFGLTVYTADTVEDIAAGNVNTDFVKVDIPDLSSGYGDSHNRFAGYNMRICELSNGDLMISAYGQFHSDTTVCPYFLEYGVYEFHLYRVWTLFSHDMGKTWEFGSSVADVQTYPIPDINAEGYCEPFASEVEDGHIVMALRTSGHEVVSPLYITHSYDYGKSWSAPEEILSWGVLPKLLKMSDGTLVLGSGHIHNFLMFSDDNGKTWSEPFFVNLCDGKWDLSTSGYNALFESEPGVVTMVYDDPKEGIAEGAGDYRKRKIYVKSFLISSL